MCGVPRYSYQFAVTLRPEHRQNDATKAAATKALQQVTQAWMQSCEPISHIEGPCVLWTPEDYGFAQGAPHDTFFGDFASFSAWRSVEELLACYQIGLRSGQVHAIRNMTDLTVRLLHELSPESGYKGQVVCPGTTGYAPAAVRYSFSYVLDHTDAHACSDGASWLHDLVRADGHSVRYSIGCDVAGQGTTSLMFGSDVAHTADMGGNVDFKSMAELKAYLNLDPATQKPGVVEARNKLRHLSAKVMRIAVALPPGVQPNASAVSSAQDSPWAA